MTGICQMSLAPVGMTWTYEGHESVRTTQSTSDLGWRSLLANLRDLDIKEEADKMYALRNEIQKLGPFLAINGN